MEKIPQKTTLNPNPQTPKPKPYPKARRLRYATLDLVTKVSGCHILAKNMKPRGFGFRALGLDILGA